MTDVEVVEAFLSLCNDGKLDEMLRNVEYVKSYEVNGLLVIVLRGLRSLPRTFIPQLEEELGRLLNRKVRLVESSGNLNDIAMQLAAPARILTVSTSWLPDGTTETIVKILRSEVKRLPMRPSEFARVLSQISGVNVKVEIIR